MILSPERETHTEKLREKEISRQREGETHTQRKEHRERQRQDRGDYGHITLYYYTIPIVLFYYLSLSCLSFLMTSL